MTLKSSLARGLAVAATVGLVGLGSTLAAAPASAAVQGDRVEGPFVMTDTATAGSVVSIMNVSAKDVPVTGTGYASVALAEAAAPSAAVWSFPAPGTKGQIMQGDLCLQIANSAMLTTCSAAGTQQFAISGDGSIVWSGLDTSGLTLRAQHQLGWGYLPVANRLQTQYLTPVATYAFTVTSPNPDIVETIESDQVTFTGTAAPAAVIEIQDADNAAMATTVADEDGNWTVTLPLPKGMTSFTVASGAEAIAVRVVGADSAEGAPVVDPTVALGALIAAGTAGMGFTAVRRRQAGKASA